MSSDSIIGKIENLAFGGEGILRSEGLVLFVPFTAPGESVRCEVVERKKNFARARLGEVLTQSPHRVTPKCPYFGVCGGCQLQHLDETAQLQQKRQWIVDALSRIGKVSFDSIEETVSATAQWEYRRHISLRLIPDAIGHYQVGYTALDNISLVEAEQCPIFIDPSNPLFQNLRSVVSELIAADKEPARVTLMKQRGEKYLLHFHFLKIPPNSETLMKKAMEQFPEWKGVIVASPKRRIVLGAIEDELVIDGLTFQFTAGAFIQNHPEQSLKIYQAIQNTTKEVNATTILDLYCGIGISSLLAAKTGAKVIGVEYNAEAVNLAKSNAKSNSMEQIEFIRGDVKIVLKDLLEKHQPDFIIVNPPRTGLDPEVSALLAKATAKEMIYISCMPSTLARDLKVICEGGFRINHVVPYDMFPQTAHVETFVHLKKND